GPPHRSQGVGSDEPDEPLEKAFFPAAFPIAMAWPSLYLPDFKAPVATFAATLSFGPLSFLLCFLNVWAVQGIPVPVPLVSSAGRGGGAALIASARSTP